MEATALLPVEVEVIADPCVNVAMQQNDVPVLKRLRLHNRGETALRGLAVTVATEPEFATPLLLRVDAIAAGGVHEVRGADLELLPEVLFSLDERLKGSLVIRVTAGEAETVSRQPVELLAPNEWMGLRGLPELLAAFVVPNARPVAQVLKQAAGVLRGWGRGDSLCGYQAVGGKAIGTQVAAIYEALIQHDIAYVSPPASFGASGQKVRLPAQLMEEHLATCLDITLLMCACLEQAGLHPLIILMREHAFAGVWLEKRTFPVAAMDEMTALKKRVELGEILVFEPTAITSGIRDFERAVSKAQEQLENLSEVLVAIDVRQARVCRILPLPQRQAHDDADQEAESTGPSTAPELAMPAAAMDGANDHELTRLERWQNRLLDLSLRNYQLNFRNTKKTLPILAADLATLEDGLAEGQSYEILAKPEELRDRDAQRHRDRTGEDALAARLHAQLEAGRIHAELTPKELETRLLGIFRAARTGEEETGVSGLFLAVGFLRWYETPTSETPRLAPILLLPVSLTRESVRAGFRLQRSDDDARLNVTLLELLKRDFDVSVPGLAELPEDEAGLDVPRILQTVRRAIRDLPRWEIVEDACLGLFTFTKFMMWLDLRERLDHLQANPVVAHLTNSPDAAFEPGATFPEPDKLDDAVSPDEVHCPLGADSTQLAVILAAARGRSFVLQGPPGTGKSHTITNLICHSLAEGKTVLFVSEKMAALNVVRSRLDWLGLGPFCLELHSNKANKKEVLRQFGEALAFGPRKAPAAWATEAAEIQQLREALNSYVRALHRPHRHGWTPFAAVAKLVALREAPAIPLSWPDADTHDADELRAMERQMEQLAALGQAIGEPARHPWFPLGRTTHSMAWQRDLQSQAAATLRATRELRERVEAVLATLRLELTLRAPEQPAALATVAELLIATPDLPPELLRTASWAQVQGQMNEWLKAGRRLTELTAALDAEYDLDMLFREDLRGQLQAWRMAEATWFLPRWLKQRRLKTLLKGSRTPGAAASLTPQATLEAGAEAQALRKELAAAAAAELLGPQWRAEATDWERLAAFGEAAAQLRQALNSLANGDVDRAVALREELATLLEAGGERFAPDAAATRELTALVEAWRGWQSAWEGLVELGNLHEERLTVADGDWLAGIIERLERWEASWESLRDWCLWNRLLEEAAEAGLQPLIDACTTGRISADQLPDAFLKNYLEWWYALASDALPELRDFSSTLHEHKIAKFREIDERYLDLTRQHVIAMLSARLPTESDAANPNSELGRLRRELQKKSRHIAIRKLLEQCQTIVPRLKPCMLMSPLSVAQYLGTEYPAFDLVVFDEASQIPVWDAIGAIGRGRGTIVVGDPKQLPPTSFFSRVEEPTETTDDFVEDLESILDECIAGGLHELRLGWHYRSRHESLISFSNYHYYDNRLLTFPSAEGEALGVHFHHLPDGVYDRSKSRTNRVEAAAIVAEILERLRDPARKQHSIGVVTFSQAQQGLIEDLLDQERAADPGLEFAFSDERQERLFVKNLENVQGDERDIILFSICYGPDTEGRISMNFGPLNQSGGERRLNVAITRARRAVHVYSSIRGDQVDLSRTQARGVQDLRAFLEYAERGPETLGSELTATGGGWDSPLEKQIGEALQARGWRIHRQVGCSGYRIDIAVLHPNIPGRYMLGIEADGAAYHSAASARDRDKLRQSVLEGLGWRIHRIWSTDWWLSPDRELEKLESVLHECIRLTPAEAPAPAPPAEPPAAPEPVEPPAAETAAEGTDLPTYEAFTGDPFGDEVRFETATPRRLQASLRAVLKVEAPIVHELLVRRVADGWGLARLTKARRQSIEQALKGLDVAVTGDGDGRVYWEPGQEPALYVNFRTHAADDPHTRRIEEIGLYELANAANYVVRTQGRMPPEDWAREVARLFNCNRVTSSAREHLLAAFDLLHQRQDGADA